MSESQLIHRAEQNRFELTEKGHTAFLTYSRRPGSIRLVHTEVPPELQGGGVGSRLVAGTLQYARNNGLTVVPQCKFVIRYLRRHPEYLDTVGPEYRHVSGDRSE